MAPSLQGYLSPVVGNSAPMDYRNEQPSPQRGEQAFADPYSSGKALATGSSYYNNANTTEANNLFDFNTQSRTASPGKQDSLTKNGFNFDSSLTNSRPLSPPDSAVFPSEEWQEWQNFEQSQMPHNILTQIDPTRARTQFGQTTPPDDDISSNLEYQLSQQQYSFQPAEDLSTDYGSKRRQPTLENSSTAAPPKRVRKSTARNKNIASIDPNDPEENRRSKFLERNRVAASKCRQKKKEWTQNLENKARDLQRQNNNLRLIADSCKEEILFLKEEMLKHTSCGCDTIQDYLKQGANAYEDFDIVKREPISGLPSPVMSAVTDEDHDDMTMVQERDERWQGTVEENLEALLRPQYGHDTSNEGIASRICQ